MVTFNENLEATEQKGLPEFYTISYGDVVERYTSWHTDLTFEGYTYNASSLTRSGFRQDGKMTQVTVDVAAPMLASFLRYIATTPIEATQVVIKQAVRSDLTVLTTLFTGEVRYVSHEDGIATARCVQNSGNNDLTFPRIVHQPYCNWQLFETGCGLNSSAYLVAATISGISDSDYTCSWAGSYADGYFTGGWVEIDSDMRLITKHVGYVLSLQIPFDATVIVTDVLDLYPGCDGSPTSCKTKFLIDNYINFVGFPLIPSSNPVMWGVK